MIGENKYKYFLCVGKGWDNAIFCFCNENGGNFISNKGEVYYKGGKWIGLLL